MGFWRVALLALVGGTGFAIAVAASTGAVRDTTRVTVHVREWEFTDAVPDTAPTGTVVFTIVNDGSFAHSFSINGHTTPPIPGGTIATLTVVFAEPGAYTFNSTVDDVDKEMVGVFTVTGAPVATTPPPPTTPTDPSTSSLPLVHVADVPLPGGSSRFDYQALDGRTHRLYIAHLGASQVIAVDVKQRRVVRDVGGISSVHGVIEAGRIYATATGSHQLVALRARDLHVLWRAPAGSFPDGLAYEPTHKRVFVADETGGADVVVDARRGRRVRTIELGGEAGNVQYNPVARRVFAAVAGREQLAVIDPRRLRIVARYALPGCQGAHGVHLDPPRRLAFVACEDNARLLVVDLRRGRTTATFSVGETPDVLDFDPGLRRLYVADESGVVAVFAERGRGLTKLGQDFLAPAAHSVAVDPATHLVYFPLEGGPVLRVMRPRG